MDPNTERIQRIVRAAPRPESEEVFRLEGWFRAEWFRNSSFEECVLPESLSKQQLVDAGNTVD
jgi:hypothetical protein